MKVPQIINKQDASTGDMGQQFLAGGKRVALRRWAEEPGEGCDSHVSNHETVGYLLSGKLEVEIDGQRATLEPGDSWLVPEQTTHSYRIIEPIVAIEATSPPARHSRQVD